MSASLPHCEQVAVPLILRGDAGVACVWPVCWTAGSSGSVQVICISASLPHFSHLQTCFLTMLVMGISFRYWMVNSTKKPDTLSDGIILIPDLQDVSIKIVEY
jgi:hypothetical protein